MAEPRTRPYSRPVFEQSLTLVSEQAQRVLTREFTRVVNALYTIDVILRIIGEDREIDDVEGVVNKLIADCGEDVQAESARLEKLRDDHGITQTPRYTNPVTTTVRIVSPQSAQFVALLNQMDRLMIAIDSLWLCGVLTNKQRAQASYQWQQRLLRLGRRIVEIERRARASAQQRGKMEELTIETDANAGTKPSPAVETAGADADEDGGNESGDYGNDTGTDASA